MSPTDGRNVRIGRFRSALFGVCVFSPPIARLGGNFNNWVLNRKANRIGHPESAAHGSHSQSIQQKQNFIVS